MVARRIDRQQVKELFGEGKKVTEIAKELDVSKGSISKILKDMGLSVALVPTTGEAAVAYVETVEEELSYYTALFEKVEDKLKWIEDTVPQEASDNYRAWIEQTLKYLAEARKLLNAKTDTKYKLFKGVDIQELIQIINEEIACESIECQQRIAERFKRRFGIRPGSFHREAN